jgi:methyl-accepting chemotaxis protein
MKNWSIRRRINAGFAAITLIALAFGLFAILRLSWIKADAARIVQDSLPAMDRAGNLAEQIQSLGDKSSVLFMKAIMSPSDELRAGFAAQVQTNLAMAETLAADYQGRLSDADEKKLFTDFKTTLASYEEVFARGVQLCGAGKTQEAMELKEGELEPALNALLGKVHALEKFNRSRGEAAGNRIQAAVTSARNGVWAGLAGLLLAAGSVSLTIIFSTTKILSDVTASLDRAVARMSSAGAQVADSSQAVADNASAQAASIEQVTAALEQMITVAKTNVRHAHQATEIARHTRTTAENGSQSMIELDTAVQEINAASGDIAKIVRTIDEIAFQTNILALNAAVEAARAGEAGMGFAVVADEVRNLAQRSAQAARETATRIDGTLAKAAKGAELSRRLKENFNDILANVREADKLDETVAGISQEQAEGIAEINVTVTQLDQVTQSNAASAEESAAAAAELGSQSGLLKATVAELLQLVGSAAVEKRQEQKPGPTPAGGRTLPGGVTSGKPGLNGAKHRTRTGTLHRKNGANGVT